MWKDTFHNTLVEMLGKLSFRDYLKAEAIAMAWVCLSKEFKLDPKQLYERYFGGDKNTPCDDKVR